MEQYRNERKLNNVTLAIIPANPPQIIRRVISEVEISFLSDSIKFFLVFLPTMVTLDADSLFDRVFSILLGIALCYLICIIVTKTETMVRSWVSCFFVYWKRGGVRNHLVFLVLRKTVDVAWRRLVNRDVIISTHTCCGSISFCTDRFISSCLVSSSES